MKGNPPPSSPALRDRIEKDALTLCRALGYDLNTVEFAVEGGVPYAIDFLNPAPDAEITLCRAGEFRLDRECRGRDGGKDGAAAGRIRSNELRWARLPEWQPAEEAKPTALARRRRSCHPRQP